MAVNYSALQYITAHYSPAHYSPLQPITSHYPLREKVALSVPIVKKNTKCDLSSDGVRNRVYRIGTQHYLEKFYKAQLDLRPYAFSLRASLSSEGKKFFSYRWLMVMVMVDGVVDGCDSDG
jgi:hypothetical protein